MEGGGLAPGHGDVGQGPQARIAPAGEHLEPLGGQRPVEAGQPGHVAHGPQGRQIEPLAQVRLGPAGIEQPPAAGFPVQGGEQHEDHPGGGQVALARPAVGPVGIDQGRRGRGRGPHHVMVDDHDRQGDLRGGGQGDLRRRAAVHGDHQGRPLVLQLAEDGGGGAVALPFPVRDIDAQRPAHLPEPANQQGRAGGPVHVIVGKDHGRPPVLHGLHQEGRGAVHVGEARRIGKQRLQGGVEEVAHGGGGDPAGHQRPGQGLAQALRPHQGPHLIRPSRAHLPPAAGQGAVDLEKRPLRRVGPRRRRLGFRFAAGDRHQRRCLVRIVLTVPVAEVITTVWVWM